MYGKEGYGVIVSKFTPQERQILIILAMVQFTHVLDFVIMMPLGPQLMRSFSISATQFGFLVSAYTLSASVSGLIGSLIADRFDRKRILIFLYSGFIVGTFLCAISPSYLFLFLARALAGGFGGMSGAMVFSIIGDAIRSEKRGTATGIVMSSFSLASVLGIPIGLFLAQKFSWHAPFFGIAFLSCLNLIFACKAVPSMRLHLEGKPFEFNFDLWFQMLKKPLHVFSNIFIFSLMLSNFIIIPFISPSLVANGALPESDLVYVYAVGGFFNFFTSQLVGRMVDKFGGLQVFVFTAILSLFPIWLITHQGHVSLVIAIVLVALFMILSSGRMVPAMSMINSVVRPQERGRFMSLNSSVQQLGAGLGAFFASMLISQGADGHLVNFDLIGYFSIVLVFISMALGLLLTRSTNLMIAAERN